MKKVLLIAPDFNNYTDAFSRSISKCGYNVKHLSFTPYNWKTALLKKMHLSQEKLIAQEIDAFNIKILNKYKLFLPDFVIAINGDFIKEATLKEMGNTKKGLWLYDSITRYPRIADNWNYYDLHYVFEQSDIAILNGQGKKAVFLPQGYDDAVYAPIEKKCQDIDISFVGAMYGDRKETLEHIARHFDSLKIEFYGSYVLKRDFRAYVRFLGSDFSKVFKNKRITHEEANLLYAKSKININILHEQSKAGWNARLDEILGAAGFQLVSHNDLISQRYSGMLDTFKTKEELVSKIEYYLSHPELRDAMRLKGYRWTKNNETYIHRFRQIMADLESL